LPIRTISGPYSGVNIGDIMIDGDDIFADGINVQMIQRRDSA
jgi:hypothetical protein